MSHLERRDFLKLSALGLLSLRTPNYLAGLKPPETYPGYPLTREGVRTLNGDPDFWLRRLGKSQNPILVLQHDEAQYPGYDNPNYSLQGFMNNACGQATLTIVRRWAEYIFTGDVPDRINILNTYRALAGKTYTAGRNKNINPINIPGGRSGMSAFAIKDALKALDEETGYYRVVEITPPLITSPCGKWGLCIDNPHLYNEWPNLFDETNNKVTSKGGVAVVFIAKYGGGHISLLSSVPKEGGGKVLFIDPKGYDKNRSGIIEIGHMAKYTRAIATIIGVVPNLPTKNSVPAR